MRKGHGHTCSVMLTPNENDPTWEITAHTRMNKMTTFQCLMITLHDNSDRNLVELHPPWPSHPTFPCRFWFCWCSVFWCSACWCSFGCVWIVGRPPVERLSNSWWAKWASLCNLLNTWTMLGDLKIGTGFPVQSTQQLCNVERLQNCRWKLPRWKCVK